MRKTLGDTKEALEFQAKIDTLSQQARDHLRMLLLKVIDCYTEDDAHGVFIAGRDGESGMHVVAINADELTVASLLANAGGALMEMNMEDMPEKGMLN